MVNIALKIETGKPKRSSICVLEMDLDRRFSNYVWRDVGHHVERLMSHLFT